MNERAFLKSLARSLSAESATADDAQRRLERCLIEHLAEARGLSAALSSLNLVAAEDSTVAEQEVFSAFAAESVRRNSPLPIAWLGICYELHQAERRDEERQLARRKGVGVYYTPAEVVRYICRQTVAACAGPVVDPACGCGIFLLEIAAERAEQLPPLAALGEIYGVDIDPHAVHLARIGLWLSGAGECDPDELWRIVCRNVIVGDALQDATWQNLSPAVDRFEAVVGNPPYVNVRLLSREQGSVVKQRLAREYATARGNFDLYVLFLERAYRLLRPGGKCGMIVPNKLATLNYAEPCRELLLTATSLQSITDLTGCRVFQQAGVYPYVVVWKKERPATDHRCRIVVANELHQIPADDLNAAVGESIPQSSWTAKHGLTLRPALDVEARVPTIPLGKFARLETGTTGFRAQRLADALLEQDSRGDAAAFSFIVSRHIDRYRVTFGRTRFASRIWHLPCLPVDSPAISAKKRSLYAARKIVLAGLSKTLEAAYDPGSCALGVQVFAVVLPNEVDEAEWWYLLGLLNSRLLSHLFQSRFAAKRLAGDYLALNKGQLVRLPIRVIAADDVEALALRDRIAKAARQATEHGAAKTLDAEINQCVERLYGIAASEY